MPINSRSKGARAERELANLLKEEGYGCRRGQQFSGANGDADVVGLPYVHIECKHVEKLNLEKAMQQSVRDARKGEFPCVFHRKNGGIWNVTMKLNDWIQLYREWESGQAIKGGSTDGKD